jgi:poly(hydroxyalkanoate) depolymerase family esterase
MNKTMAQKNISGSILIFFLLLIITPSVSGDFIESEKSKSEPHKKKIAADFKPTLISVQEFGENPGDIMMYKFIPSAVPKEKSPLVVVLHGCFQTAVNYDTISGWSYLAEQYDFYLLYPQQKAGNNIGSCWNWFDQEDSSKESGETLSIMNMIKKMKVDHLIDEKKIFVTGISSGGFMATQFLVNYPDIFAGAGINAGGPAKCAKDATEGFSCMTGWERTPKEWGNLARSVNPGYKGDYPIISIFHGTDDRDVALMSAYELIKQWTNLYGIDINPKKTEQFRGHVHKIYYSKAGKPVIELYELKNMPHGTAVHPGTEADQGGIVSAFSIDAKIWSPYYSAKFWGIVK